MKNLLFILLAFLGTGLVSAADRPKEVPAKAQPKVVVKPKPAEVLKGDVAKPRQGKPVVKGNVVKPVKFRRRIVYKLPRLKAPKVSTGPGARGSGDDAVTLSLLAPEHAGLTCSEHPRLYWFQSRVTDWPMEVTLVVPGLEEPVLELAYPKAPEGHLQEVDLKQHGVVLRPGVTYRWSVAMITDPARRSTDLVASGVIELVESSGALTAELGRGSGWERAAVCAREGIWYDAVARVARLEGKDRWEGLGMLADQAGLKVLAGWCGSQLRGSLYPPE